MSRVYFYVALIAWILCALIVTTSAPRSAAPLAASHETPPAGQGDAAVLRPTRVLPLPDASLPAPTTVSQSTSGSIEHTVAYAERALPDERGALAPGAAVAQLAADISRAATPAAAVGSSFDVMLNSGRLARLSH
jgi:hypothetical protein